MEKDAWQKYLENWGGSVADAEDDKWVKWQELLLLKYQDLVNKEKIELGGHVKVTETYRRGQLMGLIREIKEIPTQHHVKIVDTIIDDMFRYGPIEPLMRRDDVSDVQIFIPFDDGEPQVIKYADRKGRHYYKGKGFRNYRHAFTWLNRHLAQMGDRYDPAEISKDATFPNGERMHIISGCSGYSVFDPNAKDSKERYRFVPCMIITIRRFLRSFTVDELTNQEEGRDQPPEFHDIKVVNRNYVRKTQYFKYAGGMADPATMDYLRIMVALAKNHLIAGSTGVGKTTLANALTGAIPPGTVLIVIEESAEMQPQCQGHVIRLQEVKGVFDLAEAMKATLRMFPDRIFIAEIRDALAFTFIRAIQSGHDGSSTTLHADSCLSAIDVLINFAANHPSHPERDMIRDIVYRRIHTIMHARSVKDGPKQINRFFDEVIQLIPGGGIHTVMKFHQVGIKQDGEVAGYFEFIGPTDEFIQEMFAAGIPIPDSWGWEVATSSTP